MTPFDFNKLGNDFQRQGAFKQAQNCYEQAVRLEPYYLPALANLATMLSLQNKLDAAEIILRRIVAHTPYDADQWLALGNVMMRKGDLDDCMIPMMRALELRPENPDVHINLAAAAYRRREYDAARDSLEHVLSLGQTHHSTYFDLAHAMLAKGDLETGLDLYEYRWNTLAHSPAWDHHIPEWQGQDLTNSHILIHAEQGFGDTIMLSRFLTWVRAKKITFAVPTSMVDLFTDQMFDIDVIDIDQLPSDANETFDFQSPTFSMLRWLKVSPTDITGHPYLTAPCTGGRFVVPREGLLNVGICWASGNHTDKQAAWRRRITSLRAWLPFAENADVQLWSLQRDTGTADIADLGAGGLIADLMPNVNSWGDTASIVSQLDLVISVDTGVAHLAGALGIPTWMLSPQSPCWRWWNIRDASGLPWYENFRIYWRGYENNLEGSVADCRLDLMQAAASRELNFGQLVEEI